MTIDANHSGTLKARHPRQLSANSGGHTRNDQCFIIQVHSHALLLLLDHVLSLHHITICNKAWKSRHTQNG
ncbi:Unknown protein sequence [Pseudomonas savastanoi pv. phaseolicola]|nr:Unknown protein sequence [Pseudomonas savastanoi pv. phaseolicola]